MLRSLRVRLVVLAGSAFVPMLALTIADRVHERQLVLANTRDEAAARIERALDAQRELVADGARYLRTVKELPALSRGDSLICTRAAHVLRQWIDSTWTFTRTTTAGITDCSGAFVATMRDSTHLREVLARVPATDSVLVDPHGYDARLRTPIVEVHTTLHDTLHRTTGLLTVHLPMMWVRLLAEELAADSQSVVTIVDANALVLARYPEDTLLRGRAMPRNHVFQQIVRTRNGSVEGIGIDGIKRLYIFRELPTSIGPQVFVSVGYPSAPIYAAANASIRRSAVILFVLAAAAVLLATWAADRFVLRDVRAILDATERLGQGDGDARTGLPHHEGELGQLAEAFDTMASRLADRQERLAQAQKMESVGQLAGGVAHDFNNLLTAIIGNTEAALDSLPPNHQAREELHQVMQAARRSSQLTKQLLAFARRQAITTRVVQISKLVQELTQLLRRLIGEHITLDIQVDEPLRTNRVDTTQFEQMIINLAINARDAMPKGGTLTIRTRNLDVVQGDPDAARGVLPGPYVELSVTDTGVGMTPEVVRRAFEPFFTTKGVGEGTGLGLAMVYGSVKQHNGHVEILSTVGEGTTVRIILPALDTGPGIETTGEHQIPTASEAMRGTETLLLVEDEAVVRAVSARVLRSRGYEVIEAVDGASALEIATEEKLKSISMVMTDLIMPHMGGVELAQRLRERRPDLPVLIVSGYSDEKLPASLAESPITGFLEKPFNTESLLTAVRTLLDQSRAVRT